jgi:serine/threonine-protein kinase
VAECVGRAEQLRGARIGQHEIVRLIGQGATASVYEARHVALGTRVAIKVLHEHFAANAEVSGRFLREGRIAAQLRHPGIVDVFDVGVDRGGPYLVMELLEGRDLRAELDDRVKLAPAEAVAVALPIVAALSHAHDHGAVHRDLKPANVFITRDRRGDPVPKLVDFGLSKILVEQPEHNPLTGGDTVVGTVLYMPPEQTYGTRFATGKSDQYSLGAILYECLTGEPPFASETLYKLIVAIRGGRIPPPRDRDPRIPEGLEAAVMRALDRDPEKRFADVRALGAALLPFADDRVRAPADGSSKPIVRAARERAALAQTIPESGSPSESAIRRVEPLPCPAGEGPFHIKGMAYRGVMHLVATALPGGLDALCSVIEDPSVADFVRQPFLATEWYDLFPMLPLMAATARALGRPLDQITREGAMAQCRYDASTVFRTMFTAATLETVVDRMGRFGARYYDFGTFDGWLEGPGRMIVRKVGVPAYVEPWFAPMHAGYSEETVRTLGAKHAEGTERATLPMPPVHGFPMVTIVSEVRWR